MTEPSAAAPLAPIEAEQAIFADRSDAGRQLSRRLAPLAGEQVVVVALPRGGVPVADQVAAALDAPLEILAVRKLAAPQSPEYGIGAIAEDGSCVIDAEATKVWGISNGQLDAIIAAETTELARRVAAYRGERAPIDIEGKTVVLVDDGVATGITNMVALRALRRQRPERIVLAVPVCSPDALRRLRPEADQVICLRVPRRLRGVGQWYRDFSQVSDEQVLLELQAHTATAG